MIVQYLVHHLDVKLANKRQGRMKLLITFSQFSAFYKQATHRLISFCTQHKKACKRNLVFVYFNNKKMGHYQGRFREEFIYIYILTFY